MTNEEAIAVLNKELDEISLGEYTYHGLEKSIALEMGIKALEQEPCEDFIDRADAMTEIMMFAGNERNNDDIYIKVSDTVELLRELPSVTPQEPKTDVFDKIIADIDKKISHYDHFSSSNTANGLTMAKEIVEKYRESEG